MPSLLSNRGINALILFFLILGGMIAILYPYLLEHIGAGALKDLYANCQEQVQALIAPLEDATAEEIIITLMVSIFEVLKSLFDPYRFLFLVLFFFKYVRLVGNAMAFWSILPIRPESDSQYTSDKVTVVIPTTMEGESDLVDCIGSIRANNPARIILVTKQSKCALARRLCDKFAFRDVKIVGVPKLSKRRQLVAGLEFVHTDMTVFADDDVIWGPEHLTCLLAPLDADSDIGAVGSGMRCIRNSNPDIWNFLGIAYLERRNFNTGATNHLDGGISTLSGRTAMYRTRILQDPYFCRAFLRDNWNGQILNSDDDKFITKWIYSRGWKIHLQFAEEAVLYTTLGTTARTFLAQCLRWARSHWRGNLQVIRNESYWYRTHRWTCYSAYFGSLLTPSLVIDALLFYLLNNLMLYCNVDSASYTAGMIVLGLWIGFTKIVKLLPHFSRFPRDIKFIPISIIFGYLHGFINIYALLTLNKTTWGSRAVVDQPPTPTPELQHGTDQSGFAVSAESVAGGLRQAGYGN